MAGVLSDQLPEVELALRSLYAAARELPLPACRELGRRINEFVLFEAQAFEHGLDHESGVRRVRYIGAVRAVAEVVGRVPASTDYLAEYKRRSELGNRRLPSLSAVVKFFGGWANALAEAGLAPEPAPTRVERVSRRKGAKVHAYPEKRLVECLQACARDLGKPPTVREYMAWREDKLEGGPRKRAPGADIPHFRTYERHYGTWSAGMRTAGLLAPDQRWVDGRRYSQV